MSVLRKGIFQHSPLGLFSRQSRAGQPRPADDGRRRRLVSKLRVHHRRRRRRALHHRLLHLRRFLQGWMDRADLYVSFLGLALPGGSLGYIEYKNSTGHLSFGLNNTIKYILFLNFGPPLGIFYLFGTAHISHRQYNWKTVHV